MRIHGIIGLAAAACLFAPLTSVQAAVTYHYVTVWVPSAAGPYVPKGENATVPMEVTDAPVASSEGDMRKGDVVARHTLRAKDAIVLEAPAKGQFGDLRAGAVLARISTRGLRPGASVWCDIQPDHRIMSPQRHDCFEDSDGDGKLDNLWMGDSWLHFLGWGVFGASPINALAEPVPYRAARPEERPTAVLGYRYCDGDGVRGPPRFATAFSHQDESGWPAIGICRFGIWPDPADKSIVSVDGLVVKVAPGGSTGVLHYKVLDQLPAGPLVERFWAGAGRTASAPPPIVVPARRDVFVATGQPLLSPGPIGVGQVILSVPVKHAITGRLQNRITAGNMWSADTPVEVGQPVFGVPTTDGDITWCAPRIKPGQTTWETACFPVDQLWLPKRTPAMMPASLQIPNGPATASSAPSVQSAAIDLPRMTLTVRLGEAKPDPKGGGQIYVLETAIDWGEGPQVFLRTPVQLPPRGQTFKVMGLVFRLAPGPAADQIVAMPEMVPHIAPESAVP